MERRGGVAIVLIILVVMVMTSALVLLLVKYGTIDLGEEERAVTIGFEPLGREGYLNLKEFKFCEYVDQGFTCFNEKESFNRGENIYVVFLVESSSYSNEVMLVRNYQVKDPEGKIVLQLDEKNKYQFDTKSNKDKEYVAFSDYFTTGKSFTAGDYSLDVIVENPILGKKITATKGFNLG